MQYEKCKEENTKKEKMPTSLRKTEEDGEDDRLQRLLGSNDKFNQERFAKLSVNTKNYCGIHLRLSHRINNRDLNGLKLNPEWQIKILEENLSFLYNKNSTCSFFQMKSSSGVFNTSSNLLKIDSNYQSPTQCNVKRDTDFTIKLSGKGNSFDDMGGIHDIIQPKTDNVANSESKMCHPLQSKETIKNQTHSKIRTPGVLRKSFSNVKREVPFNTEMKPSEISKDNESDNNFEFTVEEEKIVSFVCSPSPGRKRKTKLSDNPLINYESDIESDDPEITVPKSNTIPDTVSTIYHKTDKNYKTKKCDFPLSTPESCSKLLWHPAFPRENINIPSANKIQTHSEYQISCSSHTQGSVMNQNMETSFDRETTLFREMALRSCYTMENILSDTSTSHLSVHKEIRQVRESIFSAISSKESSSNMVANNILSVLDIFKSWVKLNSYFQNKEFKECLEYSGLDQSIMNDFLQWQCVSRVFIDKFVQMLNNTFPGQHRLSDPTVLRTGFGFLTSPTLPNGNEEQVCTQTRHNSSQKCSTSVKTGSSPGLSNYWNQQRFSSDEVQRDFTDISCRRTVRPNITTSKHCSQNNTMNTGLSYGNRLLTNQNYNTNLCNYNKALSNKMPSVLQDDVSLQPNNMNTGCPCPLMSNMLTLFNSDTISRFPSIDGVHNVNNEAGLYGLRSGKGVLKVPAITFKNTPLESLNTPKCSVAPHVYMSQPGSGRSSSNQVPMKQTSSQYIDTEAGENHIKSNYMKPGSYNPPQKPTNVQTVVNNNFPVEDPPVIGIPFVYNGNHPPSKVSTVNNNMMKKDLAEIDGTSVTSPEKCWQAALSSAETFRNNLIISKPAEGPNFNFSDTVSVKSHFLLADESSQDSCPGSSNDLKFGSENEELSTKDYLSSELDLTVVETQLKTSDWLIKSFDVKEKNDSIHISTISSLENGMFNINPGKNETGVLPFADKSIKAYSSLNKSNASLLSSGSDSFNSRTVKSLEPIHILQTPNFQCSIKGKNSNPKQRKHSTSVNEEYQTSFNRKPEGFFRNPKSVSKIPITKEIICKLENILNFIWNTKFLKLVGEATVTERDSSKLELKIRSPLYFQALKCKLLNHSYDTLDQALADFHQYFLDTKHRNKGDKQCVNATEVLEQVYLNLVETHFGVTYHPSHKNFGPIGSNSIKSKRMKKTNRK